MKDKGVIQKYINNFRRHISPFLKKDIGISSKVYPCSDDGALIEFSLSTATTSADKYNEPFNKISEALNTIPQKAFGGNLEGFIFSGTNYILEDNRIILIKDNSPSQWDDKKASEDVTVLVSSTQKDKK